MRFMTNIAQNLSVLTILRKVPALKLNQKKRIGTRHTKHAIKVTNENTKTILSSLQPLISKWWCSGAILNMRFLVRL